MVTLLGSLGSLRIIPAQKLKCKDQVNADKIMEVWDTDKNTLVSFDEFNTRMTAYVKKHPEGKGILKRAILRHGTPQLPDESPTSGMNSSVANT